MIKQKKFIYHSLVFILCGTLLVNSIGASASIEEASKTQESIASENTIGDLSLEQLASKILLDEEIPELLSIESVKQNNHVNRLYNQETDLSSVIFQNRDGSKTLYSFGAPVKYVDDDGVIRDKSNSLTEPGEKPEVAYVNEENDIKTYFPKSLNSSQGIVLEAKDIRIEMVPIAGIGTIETINGEIPEIANIDDTNKIISEQKYSSSESVLNLQIDANPSTALKSNALNLAGRTTDTVVFDQVFGKGTKIIYTPDFNGFKEDIILDYYTGHNEFTFLIKTGGLTLLKENEVISFYDSLTGEKMGNLGELLIYDSSNNFEKTEYEHHYKVNESIPNEEYYVTIVVDQEFLTSQNTIYPVVVDPVLVIDNSLTGANYIQDASLWSKQPNTVYNTSSMRLGYDTSTTGSYRIVMKSNNLISNMSVIPASNNITSAYLSVNHVDNYLGDTMLVDAHPVTKAWEETTVTSGTLWSNYGSSTYSNNYYNGGPNGWRNYYITSTVKSWKAGTSSNNGIMLKARYESSPRQWIAIAASEYSTTSARPYIVINYNSVTYTTLTRGQSVNGYIEQGGVYWYKFTPLETATFTFETTGLTDTYGELYQGTTLIEPPDDDDGEGLNFRISSTLVSGIEYKLKVRGCFASTIGGYLLHVKGWPSAAKPTIKPRSDWGANPPNNGIVSRDIAERIIFHHSANKFSSTNYTTIINEIKRIQNLHMGDGFVDIGYHYIIDPAGGIWEGRELQYKGEHVIASDGSIGWQHDIGVLILGDFESRPINLFNPNILNQQQKNAMQELSKWLCYSLDLQRISSGQEVAPISTHRTMSDTDCPGEKAAPWIENELREYINSWSY